MQHYSHTDIFDIKATVRCQSICVQIHPRLRESLDYLTDIIMMRFFYVASAVLQKYFV